LKRYLSLRLHLVQNSKSVFKLIREFAIGWQFANQLEFFAVSHSNELEIAFLGLISCFNKK